MKNKTFINECKCVHCQQKIDQINNSILYWDKLILRKKLYQFFGKTIISNNNKFFDLLQVLLNYFLKIGEFKFSFYTNFILVDKTFIFYNAGKDSTNQINFFENFKSITY